MPDHGYNPDDFQRVFDVEDRHFWFLARNRVLARALATMPVQIPSPRLVLEVGCGTGNTLRVLRAAFPSATVVGVDLFADALAFARRRNVASLVQARVEQLPFRAEFDVIGLFDVLEHVQDDGAALDGLRRLLRPGGTLLVTVPAGRALWSRFDDESHHVRRYEPMELGDKLGASGFGPSYVTYFMTGLYPVVWLGRRVQRWLDRPARGGTRSDSATARELRVIPGLNGSLLRLLAPEAAWIANRRRLPFGTSLLAIART